MSKTIAVKFNKPGYWAAVSQSGIKIFYLERTVISMTPNDTVKLIEALEELVDDNQPTR